MRILFHHRIASRDGQSVHLEEMVAALRRQGHETILVGPPGLMNARFGGGSRLVSRIKRLIPGALYELLELAYNIPAFLRLSRAVRVHRPDVIYERYSLFLFAGLWTRRRSRLPLLLEVNAPLFEERSCHDGLRLHRLGRLAQGFLWRGADHVLPVTHVLGRMIESYGVPSDRITVIPNGIDPGRFATFLDPDAKARLGLPQRLVLGFTGFVRGWNAVHRLIDFTAAHRDRFDLQVLVVGDGPARASLQEHAERLGVADRLFITGVVERDDVARHVIAFDIAVIPGLTPYASPLKLFEYLQLGRAIVAPDVEAIREILADGTDALLFDPAAEHGLEDALLRLCEDAPLRARLGQAGPGTILSRSLTWSRNAQRVVALAEALPRPGRPA